MFQIQTQFVLLMYVEHSPLKKKKQQKSAIYSQTCKFQMLYGTLWMRDFCLPQPWGAQAEMRRFHCGVSMATAGRTPLCRHLHALCIQFHTLLYLGIYKQCKSPFCSLLIVHSLAVNKPPLERSWLYLALQHKDSVGKCCVVSYSQIYLKSSSFLVRRKIWRDSLFIRAIPLYCRNPDLQPRVWLMRSENSSFQRRPQV